MKKTLLVILAIVCIIGGIYYRLHTNNATGNDYNPIIDKIEKEEKKVATIITSKIAERFEHELTNYREILFRAKKIAQERPFPFTKDPADIIKTLDYILFNGIFCKNNKGMHITNQNKELDTIVAKINPSLYGVEKSVCSKDLAFMKGYLEEYSTMLSHAKEAVQELEKPILPGKEPVDIIDMLDFII